MKKKVVKLNETDIHRIVNTVINEQYPDNDINDLSSCISCLKKLKHGVGLSEIIKWLNEKDINYHNWSDLDIYIFYLENHEEVTGVMGFDDEIENKLTSLLRSENNFSKGSDPKKEAGRLMDLHSKWLLNAKNKYSADEIADKLMIYYKNYGK